jgi:CPA2 family monovalent cation:H+ antiporter-2
MHALDLIIDLVMALTAALIGGAAAQRLRQPAILGYLIAGAAIGATFPFHARSLADVPVLAEIGVALLMFALGIEFNLDRLRIVRDVAVVGGIAQIILTIAIGALAGLAFGFDLPAGIFFGSLIALSSTIVVLRILTDRGELGSLHGQIAVGVLLIQDLSVVPMMIILPELRQAGPALLIAVALAVAKAAVFLVATYVLGTRVVPRILTWVAGSGSRELFLIAIVALALGTALLTQVVGLSLAFGAFIAGLVISESEYSFQAIGEVGPIRDLFATLFFVSIGMLIDVRFILANPGAILITVALILIGKVAIGTAIPLVFRYPAHTAVATGLAIAQIGEFSFVLARVGLTSGVIDEYLYSLTLTAAIATMLASPFVIPRTAAVLRLLRATPGIERAFRERVARVFAEPEAGFNRHVVICGYGRVGRELAAALDQRGFRYLIIESNPKIVAQLRREGTPNLYGNCAFAAVLEQAGLERARVLAITIPDGVTTAQTTRLARAMNRRLDIIVRSHSLDEMQKLRDEGAAEAVLPEFEAGLEFVRHTLRRFGVSGQEIQSVISARRATYYRL